MKGGRDGGIEGKYRTDLPGDLSLANSGVRGNKSRVRQQAWNAPTSPQSRKKSHMKITEVCDGNQVKKILQNELEKVTLKHGLNMYELKDLKKDLKNNKSIAAGTDYRSACSNVRRHVESSTKLVLKKRKNKAATTIQRKVRSNKNSSGKKRRGSVGSKKRGPGGKSCAADRLSSGLDTILNDLKIQLDVGERKLVESAMKNAGRGAGGCNTVAVKKLFDGPPIIKNKAMSAYNKLGDNEGIKKYKTLKGAAEQRIKIADDKCLKMSDQSLEKHGYCKNSNNPQVKSRLDKLKANLQVKIKEDQAKIAKQAEIKAERERQQAKKKQKNEKMKKCEDDAVKFYPESGAKLPIKPEDKIEELEPLLASLETKFKTLKGECDQFRDDFRRKRNSKYGGKMMMIGSNISSLRNAIRTKKKQLEQKKIAEEKAKQEAELAKKKAEDARIAEEKAKKEKERAKIEAAKKAALLVAKLKKEADAKKEAARLKAEQERKKAEEAKKLADAQALKAEQERLKKEAAKKEAELEKKKKEDARLKAEQERKKAEQEAKKLKKEAAKKALLLAAKLETERKKKEEARQQEETAKKALADKAAKEAKEKLEREAAEKEKKLKAEQDKIKKEQEKAKKAMAEATAKAAREREAQKKKEEDKKAKDAADAEIKKQHKQALVAAKMQTVVLQSKLEKMKKEKEETDSKVKKALEDIKILDQKIKQSNDASLKERAEMIKKSLKNYTELLKA